MKTIKKFLLILLVCCTSFAYAKEVTISVGAGDNWKEKRDPQVAIWLADTDGNFIQTLYVTQRAGKKNWLMAPKNGRPESLPVWYFSNPGNRKSSSEEFDAVTSATPKGGIIFTSTIPDDKDYLIFAEFNNSFDYNQIYTKDNSGVNGQPSVVYSAVIPSSFTEEIKLSFEGCGSLHGVDGRIHDVSGLSTAKNIVKIITVSKK